MMTTNDTDKLRHITPTEFAHLGVQDIAYVRRVVVNDAVGYAMHAADGTQLALVPSLAAALATLRENDLEPVSVH
jgi:hypothetical protein